jgi:hypothetical protein
VVAKTIGVELAVLRAGTDHELEIAFASVTQQRIAAAYSMTLRPTVH